MRWARVAAFLIAVLPVLALTGCVGGRAEEVLPEAPADVTIVRHSEYGISYLRWTHPQYEVKNYEVEWRFADVPHWTAVIGPEILPGSSEPGSEESIDALVGYALTRGVDVEYCYRVRAITPGGEESEWSEEDCAVDGNWWWTVPAGNPPGHIIDLALRPAGDDIELTWKLSTIPGADSTGAVEVRRRAPGSASYETVATLPPGPLAPDTMTFVDEGATGSSYCYRLAVASSNGGYRLEDEVCAP